MHTANSQPTDGHTRSHTAAHRSWHGISPSDAADASQARQHAQLAGHYRTRADDGDGEERVLVRFAAASPPGVALYGATKWVHGALLSAYPDGRSRVRLLEGAERRVVIVHSSSVMRLDDARRIPTNLDSMAAGIDQESEA